MNSYRNIVAVAGENPARFITQIEPVRLTGNEGMALVSLFHGGVYNITSENNKIYFIRDKAGDASSDTQTTHSISDAIVVQIPVGNYRTSYHVCKEISDAIREGGNTRRRDIFHPVTDSNMEEVSIRLDEIYIFVAGVTDTPWSLLEVTEDKNDSFTIPYVNFHNSDCPAFVYVNIIEDSYINGKLSRNLGVVPIKKSQEWKLYQPPYLNYVPITTKQFSKILIEIRDVYGNYVSFNPKQKTIITLRIASINSESLNI